MTEHAGETAAGRAGDREPRCWRCGRKLAVFLTPPWEIVCPRCKARNAGAMDEAAAPLH